MSRIATTFVWGWLFVSAAWVAAADGPPLPGTKPLALVGDIPQQLLDGAHRFLDAETAASVERRARHWKRDFSSREAYEQSVQPNRDRLAKYLGVDPSLMSTGAAVQEARARVWEVTPLSIAREGLQSSRLRWHAVSSPEHGVELTGEAIVLRSAQLGQRRGPLVIVLPHLAGASRAAAVLAASGCEVIIPRLVDGESSRSVTQRGTRQLGLPHREFVYRQAFEVGQHVIGYELDTLLSLADQLSQSAAYQDRPLGVWGYGEGGMLALYLGALCPRVTAVGVSGYLGPREGLWSEPIERNVWGRLDEFGDAEIASLIAPRKLVVDACPQPARGITASQPGKITAPGVVSTPAIADVQRELDRAHALVAGGKPFVGEWAHLVEGNEPESDAALEKFLRQLAPLKLVAAPPPAGSAGGLASSPIETASLFRGPHPVDQMTLLTQDRMRESEYVRQEFWKNADRKSRDPAKWTATTKTYRDYFYDEVIGRFDQTLLPANARTRQVYDEAKYVGYEVVLDVFPDVIAYGLLLVPKDIKAGERRPVVVCQHGLEGRPQDVVEANQGERYYHRFAAKLAERGFITFAPQNLYIFKDQFRSLQRKLYPLKKTLYSVIVPQHQQACDWLASLPMVDGQRIAFYGLSYGGKTAMRVPPLVDRYCAVICSGDFNEWIVKNTSTRHRFSYIGTPEYEIFEWNLGNTFNYAEMAGLIAPRPFMVERGHRDGVGLDEHVSYEFAKVRLLYTDLKIPERTEIEYFDGPHEINGVGAFKFLHKHLNWPEPSAS